MPEIFKWIIPLAMGAVVIVLGMGLVNMMRGGKTKT